MRLRLFTPRQPIPGVQKISQEWKTDPEVIIKHDGLYARAWESEYETPFLHNGQHEVNSDKSPETSVRHDLPNDGTCTIPVTIKEDFPESFPHTYDVGAGTDTDHYIEPDVEASSEQLSPTEVNPGSTKYGLRQNPKPNCNDDYRY